MTERKDAVKIEGRQYVVISKDDMWPVGTVVTLINDDGTRCPRFEGEVGTSRYLYVNEVLLLADIEAEDAPTVELKPELPKHKFAVGDSLVVTGSNGKWHHFLQGTEVTVVEIEAGNAHEGDVPKYRTVDDSGRYQNLLETQLKPVEPKQFIPEVRQYYFADQSGKFEWNWILQVEAVEGERVLHGGNIIQVDGAGWSPRGNHISLRDVTEWTVATEEQVCQLIAAKIAHGDATPEEIDRYAESLSLDNPVIIAGEVYFRGVSIIRAEQGDSVCSGLTGNFFDPEGSVFIKKNGTAAYLHGGYRKALPHEVAKLEAAEKEHGCEYKKPLINSQGTVIEVGQYYKSTGYNGAEIIYKVTSVDNDNHLFQKGEHHLQLSTGVLQVTRSSTEIGSIYGKSAVPATPEQIAEFKSAEAKDNCNVKEGLKYWVTVEGTEISVEITRVGGGYVVVKQKSVGGSAYLETLPIDSPVWETAVEVDSLW